MIFFCMNIEFYFFFFWVGGGGRELRVGRRAKSENINILENQILKLSHQSQAKKFSVIVDVEFFFSADSVPAKFDFFVQINRYFFSC